MRILFISTANKLIKAFKSFILNTKTSMTLSIHKGNPKITISKKLKQKIRHLLKKRKQIKLI